MIPGSDDGIFLNLYVYWGAAFPVQVRPRACASAA
jgi:hypothetical protein